MTTGDWLIWWRRFLWRSSLAQVVTAIWGTGGHSGAGRLRTWSPAGWLAALLILLGVLAWWDASGGGGLELAGRMAIVSGAVLLSVLTARRTASFINRLRD